SYNPFGANDPSFSQGAQAAYAALEFTQYGLVQTVSTWRLGNASLNYAIPISLVRRLSMRSLSISLQGSNLWLSTNYRGKDPNVNATPIGNELVDSGKLPAPRSWRLQARIGL